MRRDLQDKFSVMIVLILSKSINSFVSAVTKDGKYFVYHSYFNIQLVDCFEMIRRYGP